MPKLLAIVLAVVTALGLHPELMAFEVPLPPAEKQPSNPNQINQEAPLSGIIVLDSGNAETQLSGARAGSTLRLFGTDSRQVKVLTDLNQSQTMGGAHCISIDRQRGRIYFVENGDRRLTALDRMGKVLWKLELNNPTAIAVDDKTGNIWCADGPTLVDKKTVVVGIDGKKLTGYPWGGFDIVYDPQREVFWIAGPQIVRADREGKVSLMRPLPDLPGVPEYPAVINARNWSAVSITPVYAPGNDRLRGAWVAIRSHPDVRGSRNRLVRLDDNGETRTLVELGKVDPYAVACDAEGNCWVADLRKQLLKYNIDGQQTRQLPVPAMAVVADHTSKEMVASTEKGLLRIDDNGRVSWQAKFTYPSRQRWLGVICTNCFSAAPTPWRAP